MDLGILMPLAGVLGGLVAATIAGRKERSAGAWFVIGMLFPLFGILVIAALEPGPSRERPSFSPRVTAPPTR